MTERWLVLGARGQLGRAALALAPSWGIEALGLGHAELDIAEAAAVASGLDAHRPDVVLNCAAYTAVDRCETERAAAARANAHAPGVLARACRGRARLVHVSTEYVFDGRASRPIPEEARTEPLSEYGRSKLAGERAVREAGGEALVVRAQWVFGAGPNFVRTILRAAGQGNPLRVVEDQLGRPTWTHDLAQGIRQALGAGALGTLHIACEGIASWYDLARAVVESGARRGLCPEVAVHPISTSEMPRPAVRPAYGVLGLERARALGLEFPHWRESLERYLDVEKEGCDA